MVVAFSFCSSDKPQAIRLAQWIRRLGGVEHHQCLIVHPNGTDAEGIEGPLRQVFGYVEVMRYDAQLSGWPAGPNEQHAKTAHFLHAHKRLVGPWLFLEADCLPTTSHWLDKLEMEHRLSGMPMLGALNNTVETATGRVVGKHTTGVAIYPQDFPRVCPLVRNMINTSIEYVRAKFLPPAFDCYYEAYTVPMTRVSRLIQHFWKSDSFREEGDRIACNFQKPYGADPYVDPQAVLIHGCKDSTLLDILQRRAGTAPEPQLQSQGSQVVRRDAHNVENAGSIPAPATHVPKPVTQIDSVAPVKEPAAQPITDAEMDADPNAPLRPPFPKDSPEGRRVIELWKVPWTDLQKYAARKLKLKAYGIQRTPMINSIVLKEREQGKEAWTKEIPKPAELPPPPPIQPVRQWNTGDGSNTPMSDIQYQRMMQLRQRVEAAGV